MTDDLTDEQRARALDLYNTWAEYHGLGRLYSMTEEDARAWLAVEAYVLASHTTCEPVWRPTTRDEIQAGWEVRSRHYSGSEAAWGVARRQDERGDWLTESGCVLTLDAWDRTYETTAPEPKPDPRVGLLEGVCLREGVVLTRSDAALLLSIADAAAPTNP